MAQNYIHTIFTDEMRVMQTNDGSRASYARMEMGAGGNVDAITDKETMFIETRDSFYMASVTSTGWPYMQHRGGPVGFLRHLGGNKLGFADYRGNRQHVSRANLAHDDRVSLFLIDYPNRRRLKIIGHADHVGVEDNPKLIEDLMPEGYKALAERAWLIEVIGYDWNCPQHITPRFTEAEMAAVVQPLEADILRLKTELSMTHRPKE